MVSGYCSSFKSHRPPETPPCPPVTTPEHTATHLYYLKTLPSYTSQKSMPYSSWVLRYFFDIKVIHL